MSAASIEADYFDGRSARPQRVRLTLSGDLLHIDGPDLQRTLAARQVQWPERARHGARIAHLSGGGSLYALDATAWDAWAEAAGRPESAVVRAQQSWRSTLVAVLVLLVLAAAGYEWGVPRLARIVLAGLPATLDRTIGDAAARSYDATLLLPSRLPAERQQQIRAAFARAIERSDTPGPPYELRFRASAALPAASSVAATPTRTRLGPNAFALPGGIIVVTDNLVELLRGRDDVLVGVLGHEYGHVRHRHGMRMLVQAALIGTATSIAWGDFSTVLAAAPAVLGQSAYSRDFERQADDEAIALLRADGISPAVMTELFDRLAAWRLAVDPAHADDADDLGISFASHPGDAERVQRFRDAAAQR